MKAEPKRILVTVTTIDGTTHFDAHLARVKTERGRIQAMENCLDKTARKYTRYDRIKCVWEDRV